MITPTPPKTKPELHLREQVLELLHRHNRALHDALFWTWYESTPNPPQEPRYWNIRSAGFSVTVLADHFSFSELRGTATAHLAGQEVGFFPLPVTFSPVCPP